MFVDILKTFIRFAMVFMIFVLAFSFGFHILLVNQAPFATVHDSLLKTAVMMIGEFEYVSIFHSTTPSDKLDFPSLTYAFFVGFVIIMSIIVANLLIGLAVNDINQVQEEAILKAGGLCPAYTSCKQTGVILQKCKQTGVILT